MTSDKLRTGPMADGGLDEYHRGKREKEALVSKDQISPGCLENGRIDAGWDRRTSLARPNFRARTGTVNFVLPVQPTTSVCMYVQYICIYGHHLEQSMDQSGNVANPARR